MHWVVGLLYTILACLLFIVSFFRSRHSRHDFADVHRDANVSAIKTRGQTGKRTFGRPFVTAGWIVLAVTVVVATVEIALLVLVLELCEPQDHEALITITNLSFIEWFASIKLVNYVTRGYRNETLIHSP